MQHLIIILILLSLTSCDNAQEEQDKKDAQMVQQIRAEMLAEYEAQKIRDKQEWEKNLQAKQKENTTPTEPKKESKLSQAGINITKDNISIDTNKTKKFIGELTQKIDANIQKISTDLEKGIIDAKEAGIVISEKHISIDLNKTQNLIEDWGQKIQIFVNQFEK